MTELSNLKSYIIKNLNNGVEPELLKARLKAYGYAPSIVDDMVAQKDMFIPDVEMPNESDPAGGGAPTARPVDDAEFRRLGFFDKLIMVLLDTKRFFSIMPQRGGFFEPVAFALRVLIFISILNFMITLAQGNPIDEIAGAIINSAYLIVAIIAAIFLFSVPNYVALKLFNGQGTYKDTVSVAAYSLAATIIVWIPVLGWIAALYGVYLSITGYSKVHQINTQNVVGAFMIFGFLLLIIMAILALLLWSNVSGILSDTVSIMGSGF
jgi:hypothetical protein